jgi:carbonic anhydrase
MYQTRVKPKQDPYSKWSAIGIWIILIFVIAGLPLGILVYTKLYPLEEDKPGWNYGTGYGGPAKWATMAGNSKCAGQEQSPVNLSPTANGFLGKTAAFRESKLSTYASPSASANYRVEESEGSPRFKCLPAGTCGTLTVDADTYQLVSFKFKSPSENTIDGQAYPMSMQMVFTTTGGKAAVVSVLFESTMSEETPATPASDVTEKLLSKIGSAGSSTGNLDLTTMIMPTSGYYRYKGSYTTPPCAEGVEWFIQAMPVSVKASQVMKFWKHIGGYPGNARPIQPIFDRTINYFTDRS